MLTHEDFIDTNILDVFNPANDIPVLTEIDKRLSVYMEVRDRMCKI